jgi:hypothetical protein
MAPENVSPIVVWLGSAESREVNGRVFEVSGRVISVAEGWREGPKVDRGARWNPRSGTRRARAARQNAAC